MITRRDLLKASALLVSGSASSAATRATPTNQIIQENTHPGTENWKVHGDGGIDYAGHDRLMGYGSRTSVERGGTINFHVRSTKSSAWMTIDVFRLGYYQGCGARLLLSIPATAGYIGFDPDSDPARDNVVECYWRVSATLKIPGDWASGVYLARLRPSEASVGDSYIPFVVRDRRKVDVVVQVSDFSWQAYNQWPNGTSLYYFYPDAPNWKEYQGPSRQVSFDRPTSINFTDATYARNYSLGAGAFLLLEYGLVYWLESQGYNVSYVSSLDTDSGDALLGRARCFVTAGHDEYYTINMFDRIRNAVGNGMSAAFLSGTTAFCEIGWKPGGGGRAFSRVDRFDPRKYTPTNGDSDKFPFEAPDAVSLIGAATMGTSIGVGDWQRSPGKPDFDWIFEGAESIGESNNLIGYEYSGRPLDTSSIVGGGNTYSDEKATSVLRKWPKGNWVYSASTVWWAAALQAKEFQEKWKWPLPSWPPPGSSYPTRELNANQRAVQRITANLLNRLIDDGRSDRRSV